MKKIFLALAILASSSIITSCNKMDLDLVPEDYFASGSFWKNIDQVNGAMIGLHTQIRNFQGTFWNLGEIRGGSLRDGTSFTGTASLSSASVIIQDVRESSPGLSSWAGMYAPIFQVNNFIYQVNNATFMTDAQKAYYLGQAHGIRAFYYFHLFRTYGRVPLVTEPLVAINTPSSAEAAYKARTETQKETLDFIKAEIDKSTQYFADDYTNKNQKAQWSLGATQMLKTEVYLWSAKVDLDGAAPATTAQDLQTAKAAVEAIIPKYSLQSSFANVFNTASVSANKGNNEIIFTIRYTTGEAANGLFSNFIYAPTDALAGYVDELGNSLEGDPLKIAASGSIIRYEYKYGMYQLFDAKDQRANATFLNFNKGTTHAVVLRKYLGTFLNNIRVYTDDYPIYRLSDAYLMLAEIKNKLGQDPSAEIMKVRNRAYGGTAPQFTNGSFEANELAIFFERTKEFVAEGKRWYDLRRMQDASGKPLVFRKDLSLVGVLDNVTGQNHKILWPIDLGTLAADPLLKGQQNPGYSGT